MHYEVEFEEEHEETILYIRFKSGCSMMGIVDDRTDTKIHLSGVMDVSIIDQGQYAGMSIQPAIPFGIDQSLDIPLSEIMFTVEPNEILLGLYLERSEEAVNVLESYIMKRNIEKKARDKLLN